MASLFIQVVRANAGGAGLGFEDDDSDLDPNALSDDDPDTLDTGTGDAGDAGGAGDTGSDDELNSELRSLIGEDANANANY